jgi:hypothetical protein
MNSLINTFNNINIKDDHEILNSIYVQNFDKDINIVKNEKYLSPLHAMVKHNLYELAKYYIETDEAKLYFNYKINNYTPIELASCKGNSVMVSLLLAKSNIGSSLYYCVFYKRYTVLVLLLNYNINFIDVENALRCAYNYNDKFMINLLINYIDK